MQIKKSILKQAFKVIKTQNNKFVSKTASML